MRTAMHHTFEAPAPECWEMFHDPTSHVAKFEGMGHHGATVLDPRTPCVAQNRFATRRTNR